MTTAAVPAAIVPPRPAWGSLLWIVSFTVAWTWLIYAFPALPESTRTCPSPPTPTLTEPLVAMAR